MNDNNIWILELLNDIYIIIGCVFISIIMGSIFIFAANFITRLFVIPFLICVLAMLIRAIISLCKRLISRKNSSDEGTSARKTIEKMNKTDNIFDKVFTVGFLLFWFGFLIVFDYNAIKQGQVSLLVFTIIFWIIGIYVTIKEFKR
ncbi:MAG: hypothetical protein IKF52_00460 [Clostridia bacterium]|nr:hypothetical protein [Clostridia bacterium]